MKKLVSKRPTEVVSGLALAGTVYGFLASSGVPNVVAAVAGAVVGFGPLVVSRTVDALRGSQ
jgi:hypothetical protein